MFDTLSKMPALEQMYWYIAVIATIILVIVFIMTFFGFDADADLDVDMDMPDSDLSFDGESGFQFFTFKNFVAFFAVFGWTGLTCLDSHCSTGWTLTVSIIAGIIMMAITTALFFYMYKLEEKGNLNLKNSIGKIGTVYLPIGAKRSSVGKVHIEVQNTLRELDAITDSETDLPTNSIVKVTDVLNDELLIVEKIN